MDITGAIAITMPRPASHPRTCLWRASQKNFFENQLIMKILTSKSAESQTMPRFVSC
jgi:hypothetical protein